MNCATRTGTEAGASIYDNISTISTIIGSGWRFVIARTDSCPPPLVTLDG
jgi:hypothetical protein